MRTPKAVLERRRSVRISDTLPFRLGHEGYEIEATLINVSSHGAMCRVEKDIPMMTQVAVGLSLPGKKKIRLKGAVVRKEKNPGGSYYLAIFFSKISPVGQKALDRYIEGRLKK